MVLRGVQPGDASSCDAALAPAFLSARASTALFLPSRGRHERLPTPGMQARQGRVLPATMNASICSGALPLVHAAGLRALGRSRVRNLPLQSTRA